MLLFRPPVRAVVAARVAALSAVSTLVLLAACAPDLGPMAQLKPATDYAAQKSLGASTASAWPAADWWTAYNDPQLSTLIDEASRVRRI